MRGYIETVDMERKTISGWVCESESSTPRELIIHATFDDIIVGTTKPSGTRADLRKKVTQAEDVTFILDIHKSFTGQDVLEGRLTITAISSRSLKPLSLTSGESKRLTCLVGDSSPASPPAREREVPTPQETIPHERSAASQGCLSPVYLPIGMESSEGTARLGKQGHLFLTGGNNGLVAQYKPIATEALSAMVEQWTGLFERRQTLSQDHGIHYLQTIIPEKLTVMREYAPIPIDGPTPLYSALETNMSNQPNYISGLAHFDVWQEEDDPFLKNDSHFSPAGARATFVALLDSVNPKLATDVASIRLDRHVYGMGDLVNRFYGLPIYSRRTEPDLLQMAPYNRLLVQTDHYTPATGHIGSRYTWENESAPDPRRVLVFGNSFFGTGERARELSWWGKCFFKEFYFIWGPEFDWSIIEAVRPDIVIGQTIERFLPKVPAA